MVEYIKTEYENEEVKKSSLAAVTSITHEELDASKSFDHEVDKVPNESKENNHNKRWNFSKVLSLVIIGAILVGSFSGIGYRLAGELGKTQTINGAYYLESKSVAKVNSTFDTNKTIPSIVEELGPAIVSITSKVTTNDFFSSYETEGSGTGVVFNINEDSILIVTNNHVVENANTLSVAFSDVDSADAVVVGVDPDADLAVIKVKKQDLNADILTGLKPVILGDSDEIVVGELAIAIGNPLGYSDTVTVGFISGIDRMLNLSGRNFNLIQTDAAINPGNSGGALVNENGQVIGINTIKISSTQVEGIGFAIPINTVKPIIEEILEKGYVSRPYLGVAGRDITEEISELYNLPIGVLVRDVVKNSGADDAGLQRGDIITAVDGVSIENMTALIERINSHKVGDVVVLSIKNESTSKDVEVVLKDKNAQTN
jgi:serine protease Do